MEDGTFISIAIFHLEGEPYWTKPADVWVSSDKGANWHRRGQIARLTEVNGVEYRSAFSRFASFSSASVRSASASDDH